MSSKIKTRFIAERSLYAFAYRHPLFYYWTNTFAEDIQVKEEAERRFKPVKDLIKRKGGELLYFWELTEAGRWHVHWVTDKYIDVAWFRPWMIERGWGQQMKVKRVEASPARVNGNTWVSDESQLRRLVLYLVKYCTKSIVDAEGTKKKVFGGSSWAKVGTVAFAFVPWINPTSFLYYHGKVLYLDLFGTLPSWMDFSFVVRLGVEATNWLASDPWWMPSGP